MNCQGASEASVPLYFVPEDNPEQCQWEPHPVLERVPHDDHSLLMGSGPLPLFGNG